MVVRIKENNQITEVYPVQIGLPPEGEGSSLKLQIAGLGELAFTRQDLKQLLDNLPDLKQLIKDEK